MKIAEEFVQIKITEKRKKVEEHFFFLWEYINNNSILNNC